MNEISISYPGTVCCGPYVSVVTSKDLIISGSAIRRNRRAPCDRHRAIGHLDQVQIQWHARLCIRKFVLLFFSRKKIRDVSGAITKKQFSE